MRILFEGDVRVHYSQIYVQSGREFPEDFQNARADRGTGCVGRPARAFSS